MTQKATHSPISLGFYETFVANKKDIRKDKEAKELDTLRKYIIHRGKDYNISLRHLQRHESLITCYQSTKTQPKVSCTFNENTYLSNIQAFVTQLTTTTTTPS